MRDQAEKRLLFSPHPQAHASQIEFLTAVQRVVDAYTVGFLHQAVLETISAMRGYCMALRDELAAWIEVLATGAPYRQIVSSLYVQIGEDVLRMESSYRAEQNISVQTLLQMDEPVPQDEDIARFLAAINWKVEEGQDAPLLSLELVQSGQSVPLLQRATSARSDDVITMKRKLLECAQLSLVSAPDSALDAVVRAFSDPKSLAAELCRRAEPIVELERSLLAAPARTGTMFCVAQTKQSKYEPAGTYIDAVESELRARKGGWGGDSDHLVKVWNFSDPYKAILLNTLELLPANGFRSWSESMRAYSDSGRQPPLTHHVFPAEVNAALYENRIITTRSGEYHLFHSRVVALLNDLQSVKQFILAWASGWIRLESADDLSKIEFDNPTGPRQTVQLALARNALPDPFDVITDFGRVVEPLCAQHPELAQMLSPNMNEMSVQLLYLLQKERESSTDGQSLLGWISKYGEFANARSGMADQLAASGVGVHSEAYRDLGQLVELLLEEFLGSKTRFTPLDFDTMRFFQAANWTVVERRSGYLVASPPKSQFSTRSKAICVRVFSGSSVVDSQAIQHLHEIAMTEYKGEVRDRVVMAVMDQHPANALQGHIWGYRAGERLAIVLLPSSVMRRALGNNTASIELERQLGRALGEVNLYEVSMPITDFMTFFGRAPTIEKMLQVICRGEHIGIFGLRKMGKTSLMWQLKERLNKHGVVLIDLQIPGKETMVLYSMIVQELVQDVVIKYPGIKIPNLELVKVRTLHSGENQEPDSSTAELVSAFERDLTCIYELLRSRDPENRIVLFLDEVERMLPSEGYSGFVEWEQFWGVLRGIAQRRRFLSLVVASVDARLNRTDLLNGIDNPAYKLLSHTEFLSPFTEQEDHEMIVNIGNQMRGVEWEDAALKAVHRASGGHPCISREICGLAVSAERQSDVITGEIVAEAVDLWLADTECYIAQLWAGRLSEPEHELLISLAQSQPASKAELLSHCPEDQATAFRQALASLRERHIVTLDRKHSKYVITFNVFRLWIQENILGLSTSGDGPNV